MKNLKHITARVYKNYLDISINDHQQKTRYFERHLPEILKLPAEIYHNLFIDYTRSIYIVREYKQFLKIVDEVLELIIIENIETIRNEDLYEEFLYLKASALQNVMNYKEAKRVLKALINIQGNSKKSKKLFLRISIESLRYNDQKTRTVCLLLIVLSGIVLGIELLYIRSFYIEQIGRVEQIRNILLLSGILVFLYQEIRIRLTALMNYNQAIYRNHK